MPPSARSPSRCSSCCGWSIPTRMANFGGWLMRTIGPLFKENKIARDNLTRAFPEKSAAEIDTILRGVWDNLGRVGAEFAQLDRLWDFDAAHPERPSRVEFRPVDTERFDRLANDGKPALIFAVASRQLGIAGDLRGHPWPRQRGAVPAAQYRRHRPLAAQNPRRQHGNADRHRPRRAGQDRRRAQARRSMSACWSTSITCAACR